MRPYRKNKPQFKVADIGNDSRNISKANVENSENLDHHSHNDQEEEEDVEQQSRIYHQHALNQNANLLLINNESTLSFSEVANTLALAHEEESDVFHITGNDELGRQEESGEDSSQQQQQSKPLSRMQKHELLSRLFQRVCQNESALFALLRLLLPKEDRERVYGFKTRRLMHLMASAFKKGGWPELGATLRRWIPVPSNSSLVKGAVVCTPDTRIATCAMRISGESSEIAPKNIIWVANMCERLAAAYRNRPGLGKNQPSSGSNNNNNDTIDCDIIQTEILLRMLKESGFGFDAWRLLIRILLKRVPLGVGPMDVLLAVPMQAAAAFIMRQRSLRELAHVSCEINQKKGASNNTHEIIEEDHDHDVNILNMQTESDMLVKLVCGQPFQFMVGDVMRSPYLFKWIFSKEERLHKIIPPIEGRVLILPKQGGGSRWFVPLNNKYKMRMVNLEEERALEKKGRKRHLLVLREVCDSCVGACLVNSQYFL